VSYENLGQEDDRSRYDPNTLRILINLDHPAVREALGDGTTTDVSFLRLSYEIAFSEYAIALGYETMRDDPDIPPDDLLYEIRTSLNRVSRSAAALYAAQRAWTEDVTEMPIRIASVYGRSNSRRPPHQRALFTVIARADARHLLW
jgi:hypothetical protein